MKWSEHAWKQAEAIYKKILELPFVCQLAQGTLDRERFDFYICQDALYVDNYIKVLAHIASRIPDKIQSEDFLRFALDGVMVERALHQFYIGNPEQSAVATPSCRLYMDFETASGLQPVEVEAAAVLPCFWVYQRVGEEIFGRSNPSNPYWQWISTYADPAFALSTSRAIEICDQLAASAAPDIREQMTRAFIYATKMEWLFWHSAYIMEQWKI